MHRLALLPAFILALQFAGVQAADTPTAVPIGRLPGDVQPLHYRLDLDIRPETDRFSGITEIDVDVRKPAKLVYLHGNGLDVQSATLTTADQVKHEAACQQVDPTGVMQLTFTNEIPAGPATLRFVYSAPFGQRGEGLYHSVVDQKSYAFTQFEPIDARRMFPGFDEPGFKVPFDISVTTASANAVVGNTPVKSTVPAGKDGKRVTFTTTLPLPTYLIALAVGPLDVVAGAPLPPNAVRKHPVPLRGVATHGKGPMFRFALDNTSPLVPYLENYFGIPFPYPKLDLIASPDAGGGMENAGAIVYGDQSILLPPDPPVERRRSVGAIHAHELAHQWFGDLVTPQWWDDIWLNESFASWMSFKAANAWNPAMHLDVAPALQTAAAMGLDSRISARQIRNPVTRNLDIGSAFDGITYLKGAAVLTMFENWLGEKAFKAGIRTHLNRFANKTANVDDFMNSLATGSGRPDVIPAFRSFIDQPGLPLVTATLECATDGVSLDVSQSRYLPVGSKGDPRQTWQIPLCVRYGSGNGSGKECTLLTEASTRVPLKTKSCPAFVMPNADGAGYYRFALDQAGWQSLMANFDQLSETGAIMAADSVSAAYEANRMSTDTWLAAVRTIANSKYRSVVMAPAPSLVKLRDYIVPAANRDKVVALMRAIYRPRLDALRASIASKAPVDEATKVDRELLRTKLVTFLALEARDPDLRKTLADEARRYIGLGKPGMKPEPTAVLPAQVQVALQVAVQEDGLPFVDALTSQMLASDNIQFRSEAAVALGASDDAAVAEHVRKLLLDPRLRAREPTSIAFAQAARQSQRRAVFDWFKANDEAFMAHIGRFGYRWLPRLGAGFCTTKEHDELEAFFTPMLDRMEGAKRTLAEALEDIDLCVALTNAKRDEAGRYFAKG